MEFRGAFEDLQEGLLQEDEAAFKASIRTFSDTFEIREGEFSREIINNERVLKYEGEPINFEDVMSKMNDGDLVGALEEMKMPKKVIDDPTIGRYAKEYNNAYLKSPLGETFKNNLDMKHAGENFTKEVGDPQNLEEFKDRVTRNEKVLEQLQNEMKEIKERATEAEQKGEKTVESGSKKSWSRVKFAIGLIVAGVTLDWLYNKAKEHQNELNGCWLVYQDGSKCKVQTLTCDSDARNSGQICTQAQMMGCGDGGKDPCFTTKTCIKWNKDGKTCDKYLSGCSSGKCQYCSCSQIPCPKGATLVCKNVSFGEALSDFIGKPLDWGAGVLSDIGKWIKRAIIGIIIIIAVIIGIMLLMKLFGRRKETKEKK